MSVQKAYTCPLCGTKTIICVNVISERRCVDVEINVKTCCLNLDENAQ